jgi:site-specific recombinase XerD
MDDAANSPEQIDAWLVRPDNPPQRVADRRRQAMRLSALFEEFCQFLRVEKEAAQRTIATYRWCFGDFDQFARNEVGGTVLVSHFTAELCRAYQYDLSRRELSTSTIRLRLATLGSFGKWAVRRERLEKNPLDCLTRPQRKARVPRVPRWATIEQIIEEAAGRREKAILGLMAYGGLRRSEVVGLNVGDFAGDFGLTRVKGKGGDESGLPLPKVALQIVDDYVKHDRADAGHNDPLFVVRYRTKGGEWCERRMADHRIWKLVKAIGKRIGVRQLHPHAFRHGCGTELLRRTRGNLRAVQAHLRHSDIQTTTRYTRLTQTELKEVVGVFDGD